VSFRLVLQTARDTPPPVLRELERAAMDIMKDPSVRARLQTTDLAAQGTSSAQAQQLMAAEMARWEPLVRRLELKAN
jgi:tripartite-type tricarboxylate transporter receptor subunit TctC